MHFFKISHLNYILNCFQHIIKQGTFTKPSQIYIHYIIYALYNYNKTLQANNILQF